MRIVDITAQQLGPATNRLVAPLDMATAPTSIGPFAVVVHHRMATIPPGALPVDADVRPHPHIGLVAISYVMEGAITHRDSLGTRAELGAGDLGITVSGAGVTHSERFERLRLLGGGLDMFQLLLALPDGFEDIEPAFFHRVASEIPTATAGGATTRWLLPTPPEVAPGIGIPTPILLADVTLDADAMWTVPAVPARGIYVIAGEVAIGDARATAGQLAVLDGDAPVGAIAPTRLLAFGGTTVGARYSWWNYFHSSLERIEAAKAAWRAGRVPLPTGDTESFTPAPPDNGRPLRRLNG